MRGLQITLLMLGLAFPHFSFGQEMISKKGVPILPEKGDFAIGINAVPIFEYFGNMFNNDSGNSVSFAFIDNSQTIYGKYYLKPNMAIRGKFCFRIEQETRQNYVPKDLSTDPYEMVTDSRNRFYQMYSLTGGIEKRRGKGRLQGFYGAELGFGVSSENKTYQYGNDFSASTPAPYTTTFFDNSAPTTAPAGLRPTSTKSGLFFSVGAYGFAGIEYFFAPKISLGGEFSWGPTFQNTGEGKTTVEYFDYTSGNTVSSSVKIAGNSKLTANSNNLNGSIFLLFHF